MADQGASYFDLLGNLLWSLVGLPTILLWGVVDCQRVWLVGVNSQLTYFKVMICAPLNYRRIVFAFLYKMSSMASKHIQAEFFIRFFRDFPKALPIALLQRS